MRLDRRIYYLWDALSPTSYCSGDPNECPDDRQRDFGDKYRMPIERIPVPAVSRHSHVLLHRASSMRFVPMRGIGSPVMFINVSFRA